MARTEITADTYRFISPNGSDTNDGLTALTPWKTRMYSWETMRQSCDLRGGRIIYQLDSGPIFTDEVGFEGPFVGQRSADDIVWQGNPSSPWATNVFTVNNSFFAFEKADFTVKHMRLKPTNGAGIASMTYSKVNYNDIVFDNAGAGYVLASKTGQTVGGEAGGFYIALGAAPTVLSASAGGNNILISGTMQFWGTPNYTEGFANVFEGGNVTSHGMTWDEITYGHAVGRKYSIDSFGTIYGSNNPSGGLPGTLAGTIAGGNGQYI